MKDDEEREGKQLLRMIIELEVKDNRGILLEQREVEGHSFIRGMFLLLRPFFRVPAGGHIGDETAIDTTNVVRTMFRSHPGWFTIMFANVFGVNAPGGDSSHGLVVGRGTEAVSMLNIVLQTPIIHGNLIDQLDYGTHTITMPALTATTGSFAFSRPFTNNHTATLTVNETGIYMRAQDVHGTWHTFCIARDLIAGGISVPTGHTLTVRYRLLLTVA